jgi:hydroxypyruvate reductase/glycerate 2-kinase
MDGMRLREHARLIWQAAVDAAQPEPLVAAALRDPALPLADALQPAPRIVVVGAGKAGAAMAAGVEAALGGRVDRVEGLVNVPAGTERPLQRIRLHAARPAGVNEPRPEGVAGAEIILELLASAGPDDVALCLLSGGGSALLPAPVEGVTLADKQQVTRLLHACGATINEMNAVRKHLSRVKGGRLAQAFRGKQLFSLIVSDVVGDPLDVIASGPTASDPTTFADVMTILDRFDLRERVPPAVRAYLERGAQGEELETLKALPGHVQNLVLGNNAHSLQAGRLQAEQLGYPVLNLGSYLEGETREAARVLAGIVRSVRADGQPLPPPLCVLSGGETTVTLTPDHGKGGRNQEFVLALAVYLGDAGLAGVVALSGGTDGEDGPTDAAGAIADISTLSHARERGLSPHDFLLRHDAYAFFDATGDLLRTGLTGTNVMDVRLVLVV